MIAKFVLQILEFYGMAIFIYVLLSWFPISGPVESIYHMLATVCEPYVGLFRRLMPNMGGLDFSPMVAILVLQLVIRPILTMILIAVGL